MKAISHLSLRKDIQMDRHMQQQYPFGLKGQGVKQPTPSWSNDNAKYMSDGTSPSVATTLPIISMISLAC